MDQSTTLSAMEANGRISMSLEMYADFCDLDRRIKFGDGNGWRGDPSMMLVFNTVKKRFEVWGIDGLGNEYEAAFDDAMSPKLLTKLRDGDWQRNDVHQRVLDNNAMVKANAEAKDRDMRGELAEKMQWAIRRDFATHLGGRGAIHSISRKVGG